MPRRALGVLDPMHEPDRARGARSASRWGEAMENSLLRHVQFPPGVYKCARCGDLLVMSGMSFFNEDFCCLLCLDDEKYAPNYAAAREEEKRRVGDGNHRYPGIGLTEEDRCVLAERREARRRPGDRGETTGADRPATAASPKGARSEPWWIRWPQGWGTSDRQPRA